MWSSWWAFTESGGPFRLGVKYLQVSQNSAPLFGQRDYGLEYHWFQDESTVITQSMGGQTYVQQNAPGSTPMDQNGILGVFQFNAHAGIDAPVADVAEVQYRNMTVDGFDGSLLLQLYDWKIRCTARCACVQYKM